jgi:hypothetical protein
MQRRPLWTPSCTRARPSATSGAATLLAPRPSVYRRLPRAAGAPTPKPSSIALTKNRQAARATHPVRFQSAPRLGRLTARLAVGVVAGDSKTVSLDSRTANRTLVWLLIATLSLTHMAFLTTARARQADGRLGRFAEHESVVAPAVRSLSRTCPGRQV